MGRYASPLICLFDAFSCCFLILLAFQLLKFPSPNCLPIHKHVCMHGYACRRRSGLVVSLVSVAFVAFLSVVFFFWPRVQPHDRLGRVFEQHVPAPTAPQSYNKCMHACTQLNRHTNTGSSSPAQTHARQNKQQIRAVKSKCTHTPQPAASQSPQLAS